MIVERRHATTTDYEHSLLYHFYTTERIYDVQTSTLTLEDHGGPFGFDIQFALEVDYLVRAYGCTDIVETGTYSGDTTEYLARQYPNLRILTCENEPTLFAFARQRLSDYPNVTVVNESSERFLKQLLQSQTSALERPFFYLDAHAGEGSWPLKDELEVLLQHTGHTGHASMVCIGDCDIQDDRYGFDAYDGIPCDARLIREFIGKGCVLYANNPNALYPFPCLQMERRSGRFYTWLGPAPDSDPFASHAYFKPMSTFLT